MANISTTTDLIINRLSQAKYDQLCASGQLNNYQLYMTDYDPSEQLSAAIDGLCTQLGDVWKKSETSSASQLSTAFGQLSDYYTKPDTSSAVEISTALGNFYTKSETSSAIEISTALATAGQGYTVTVRKLDNDGAGNGFAYIGGYQIEAVANNLPVGALRVQHVDTSASEMQFFNQTAIVVPNGVNASGYDTVYVNGVAKNNEVIQLTGDTLVELYYLFCFIEGTLVSLADGTKKPVEQITYDDELKVWNFDEGKEDSAKPFWMNKPHFTTYCWETVLESGKKIRTAGVHGHRFFSIDQSKFIYADEVVPGSKVWTEDGEDTVVSSTLVQGIKTNFYNIITYQHINVFADGILAGCSLENGLYPVKDMKFVKDGRKLRDFSEFESEVPEAWFNACRYAESALSKKYLCSYCKQRLASSLDSSAHPVVPMKSGSGQDEVAEPFGSMNLYKYKLANVAAGTESTDVATVKQVQDEVSNAIMLSCTNVQVKSEGISSLISSLVINNVTKSEYDSMLSTGALCSDQLYSIDSLQLDARDDWVINVKTPELSSDAANKAYVDAQLSNAGGRYVFDIYCPPLDSVNNMYVLKDQAVNIYTFSSDVSNMTVAFPEADSSYVKDFLLDVTNSTTADAVIELSGLDSQFAVVVKEDDDLVEMTTLAPDEMARFYITQTGFQLSGLPAFEISKKVVVEAIV